MSLSTFSHINEIVSVHSPANDTAEHGQISPQTILLLSWSDAVPRHIDKYTSLYTELFPSARIILVRSGVKDFLYRTEQSQRKLLTPVTKMLHDSPEKTLLVHVMSNAGSKQWCTINKIYFESTGRSLSGAPTIMDSAPGRAHFTEIWRALAGSLPRAFLPRMALSFIFGIALCMWQIGNKVLPGPDVLEVIREQFNDPATDTKGTRRCYIYSEEDDVVGWKDVEDHAEDAQRKGWTVDLVKVKGSTHVGHFKQDPALYREKILQTWSKR